MSNKNQAEKILAVSMNTLLDNNLNEEVNNLLKSSIEMSNFSIDAAFKDVEDRFKNQLVTSLTRSTFIDIMKMESYLYNMKYFHEFCAEYDEYKNALNFMKVCKPKFFTQKEEESEIDKMIEKYKALTQGQRPNSTHIGVVHT